MPDVFSKKKRSEVMSRIRSRGNKETEVALARLLRVNGIWGWRRHLKIRVTSDVWRVTRKARAQALSPVTRHISLSVRPDFVFAKARLAVFVDGCFWHGCPKHGTRPKGNAAFWLKKISGNQARDLQVNRALRRANWRVLRIWEHELARRKEAHLTRRLLRVLH
jgi:DNA mismatch endonuclease (patch repair protein)